MDKQILEMCRDIDAAKLATAQEGVTVWAEKLLEDAERYVRYKERLIRIMGTFDLATGHADTFDELLNSLESELSDVLGHYREALKVKEKNT